MYLILDASNAVVGHSQNAQDMLQEGMAKFQQIFVPDDDPRVLARTHPPESQQNQIKVQLMLLDTYITRGLEDYFVAAAFPIKNLPQIQQDRLAQKTKLRAQLAALVAAGTP